MGTIGLRLGLCDGFGLFLLRAFGLFLLRTFGLFLLQRLGLLFSLHGLPAGDAWWRRGVVGAEAPPLAGGLDGDGTDGWLPLLKMGCLVGVAGLWGWDASPLLEFALLVCLMFALRARLRHPVWCAAGRFVPRTGAGDLARAGGRAAARRLL
jgi:hypothetical protein